MGRNLLVVGCGIVGLTTALELLRRGEHVTLVDAADHEGLATSFANGGLLTPSMSDPWNSPGVHRHILEYLTSSSAAIRVRLRALPSLVGWGQKFLSNSRTAPYRTATLANLELAQYSLGALDEIRQHYSFAFDFSDRGALKFFRKNDALDASLAMTRFLEQHGLKVEIVDRDGAVKAEPCLASVREQIAGAIYYPRDASGDAYLFCQEAARTIAALGGTFHYGQEVLAIEVRNGQAVGVRLAAGVILADQVIIAAGVMSPALTSRLGFNLAIKPVKGYSMTYALAASRAKPVIPVIDDAYHVGITPLGSRLRVAGTAEFAGLDTRLDKRRTRNLSRFFKAIYPEIASDAVLATGKPWAGLRPVAADGRPYIGPSPVPGLWVNCGHGHLGWTLAAGSARLLADLMRGAQPEVDAAPFLPTR